VKEYYLLNIDRDNIYSLTNLICVDSNIESSDIQSVGGLIGA
jgi:hypothetical protein